MVVRNIQNANASDGIFGVSLSADPNAQKRNYHSFETLCVYFRGKIKFATPPPLQYVTRNTSTTSTTSLPKYYYFDGTCDIQLMKAMAPLIQIQIQFPVFNAIL